MNSIIDCKDISNDYRNKYDEFITFLEIYDAQYNNKYNDLIKIYKAEINYPFKIKYQVPIEKKDFHFSFETIKIASFTLLVTYILFILTNKFLSRKLK